MSEQHDHDDLVPVFTTADSTLLPVIKSVLNAEEIPYTVQGDEALGLLRPPQVQKENKTTVTVSPNTNGRPCVMPSPPQGPCVRARNAL